MRELKRLWRRVFIYPGILLVMLLVFPAYVIALILYRVIILIDETIAESYAIIILKSADSLIMWATDGLDYVFNE